MKKLSFFSRVTFENTQCERENLSIEKTSKSLFTHTLNFTLRFEEPLYIQGALFVRNSIWKGLSLLLISMQDIVEQTDRLNIQGS